jgi:hypothetical protein
MMPGQYTSRDGSLVEFDLDEVIDVASSTSHQRPTWSATLIYVLSTKAFVELRCSPQDFRGNSEGESVEVDSKYISETFQISSTELSNIQTAPFQWKFIDRRKLKA